MATHAESLHSPLPLRSLAAGRPRPTLGQVWLAAPPALGFLAASFLPAESIDLWWCLLLGSAPSGGPDPIVFTPLVGPQANVQWLAQRALAAVHGLGGIGLLLVLRAALVAVTLALAELTALRSGATDRQAGGAVWLALALVLAGGALRPQLFALPLFAVVLLLGGPLGERRWTRPLLALTVALWANLHGSFVLAPIALGLLALGTWLAERTADARGSRGRRAAERTTTVGPWPLSAERLLLAAIAAVAALANPWGPGVYPAALEVARANEGGGASGLALEWRPLELTSVFGLFFLSLALAGALGTLRGGRRALPWLVLAVPLGLLAIGGARHTSWFALAVLPLAAAAFGRARPSAPGRPTINLALLATLGLAAAIGALRPLARGSDETGLLAGDTPVALADRLAELSSRRVFAYSDWGGYLAWRLRPDGRVYVDNRFEQHPAAVWDAYRRASLAAPDWESLLDQAGADALALTPRVQAPLAAAAASSPAWRLAYADEQGLLFVRSRP